MQMILGVIEGQIRGGYFLDCILDPSVIDPSEQPCPHWVILMTGFSSSDDLTAKTGFFTTAFVYLKKQF